MSGRSHEAFLAEAADRIATQARDEFVEEVANLTIDSPIEQMMAAAILYCFKKRDLFGGHGGSQEVFTGMPVGSFETMGPQFRYQYGIHVHCQFPVGRYKADFFVDLLSDRKTAKRIFGVIECDGHDHHERTKEQARHDKARDRYFQSLGITVLRYTGSEIYRDPVKCAFEALRILERLSEGRRE